MLNTKSFFLPLLLILTTVSFVVGQGADDVIVKQHPKIKNLPVNALTVDLNNTKWVGTETGLYVFDRFAENPLRIKKQGIFATIMGENETGWVGLHSNKIGMFDRNITYSTGIPETEMIHTMAVQRSTIWLGTSKGLYKVSLKSKDQSEFYSTLNSKLPSNLINDIYVDKNGAKWIATEGGLAVFDDKKWVTHLREQNITALTEYNGDLWVAGEQKIWVLKNFKDFEERSLIDEFKASPIEDLAFDKGGNLWIASTVLGRYDKDWIPYIYGENVGFSSTHALTLAIDHADNVWVGTAGKGLFKVRLTKKNEKSISFEDKSKGETGSLAGGDMSASLTNPKGSSTPTAKKVVDRGSANGKAAPLVVNSMFIGNRIIKPGKEVGVEDQKIKIAVWDGQAEDGDTISIYYNGDCILERYDLTKDRYFITLDVKPNSPNQLVLYAHNQGARGVNTAMIALLHRDRPKEWLALTSDSQRCDKVNFKLVKR